MRFNLLLIFVLACCYKSSGQCLTTYAKLFPDKTENFDESFGNTTAVYNNLLAVGAVNSDSLGTHTGIVYLYEKVGSAWKKIGALKPSVAVVNLQFGNAIKITDDYILVGCGAVNSGVYIYRKPSSGWSSAAETALIKSPAASFFFNAFDLSADQQTLVINDFVYAPSNGAMFVYHKQPGDEWSNSITPQIVTNPDKNNNVTMFGLGGVKILGNKIACATTSGYGTVSGVVYMFNDASGNFNNFQLEARLTSTLSSLGGYGPNFQFSAAGVIKYERGSFLIYPAPSSGVWQNSSQVCEITLGKIDGQDVDTPYTNYTVDGNSLFLMAKLTDGSARLVRYQKTGATWCDGTSREIILTEPLRAGSSALFARSLSATNENTVAYSWTFATPAQLNATAVGIVSNQSGSWSKQLIAKSRLDAANVRLGATLWHTNDFLITSAPGERYIDNFNRGAVYIFKKQAGAWTRVNKINPSPLISTDTNFGSSITGYKEYLAISALSYTPAKIFIYKGVNQDFTSPVLLQALQMPTDKYIDSYGGKAMNKDWLVVSALSNPPSGGPRNILLFFKKGSNEQWTYSHDIEFGNINIFTKSTSAIDMDDQTIVASDGVSSVHIIELNANQQWEKKYTLQASDPDRNPIVLDPKWPTLYMDFSYYGRSVFLDNDKIFVGAPGKDNFGTDVGAIYVYTRLPGGSWSSGRESNKLVPASPTSGTMFGSTIEVFNNTLITSSGATTGAGRAFVVQAKDYFWNSTVPLLTLSGDTFATDWFGFNLGVDEDDIFITAPNETNTIGTIAGAVYIVNPPPIVKLEPPVCLKTQNARLFGYPFGGVWSGPGITDPSTGAYDPMVAGVGTHEFTYKTPNCFYEGKLILEIGNSPQALLASGPDQIICKTGKTNTTLALATEAQTSYTWSYHKKENEPFNIIPNAIQSSLVASDTGYYEVKASNKYCEIRKQYTVVRQNLNVTIAPLPVICDLSTSAVSLTTNYKGGLWQLSGNYPQSYIDQSANTLSVKSMANGTCTITYNYTSPEQCTYKTEQKLTIDRLAKPLITQSGNLCTEGKATLTTPVSPGITRYLWSYLPSDASVSISDSDKNYFAVSINGNYGLKIKNAQGCESEQTLITIHDTFTTKIIPEGNNLKTCSLTPFILEIETSTYPREYDWFYYATADQKNPIVLNNTSSSHEIKATGYYSATIKQGACTYSPTPRFVTFSKADTLSVANVFTPNGDGFNERFAVSTSYPSVHLEIINRYGASVFSGDGINGWSGEDFSPGVYFWYASFLDCENNKQGMKGYVQLIR